MANVSIIVSAMFVMTSLFFQSSLVFLEREVKGEQRNFLGILHEAPFFVFLS